MRCKCLYATHREGSVVRDADVETVLQTSDVSINVVFTKLSQNGDGNLQAGDQYGCVCVCVCVCVCACVCVCMCVCVCV